MHTYMRSECIETYAHSHNTYMQYGMYMSMDTQEYMQHFINVNVSESECVSVMSVSKSSREQTPCMFVCVCV